MKRAGTFDLIDLDEMDLSLEDDGLCGFAPNDAFAEWSTPPYDTLGVPPSPDTSEGMDAIKTSPWAESLVQGAGASELSFFFQPPTQAPAAMGPIMEKMAELDHAAAEPGIFRMDGPLAPGPVATAASEAGNDASAAAAAAVAAAGPADPAGPPGLALRLSSTVETLWYAERPFPSFTVDLVRKGSTEPVHLADCSVSVKLLDAYDRDASDRLAPQIRHHQYALQAGTAVINSVRFCGVSSKAGGAFRLVLSLNANGTAAEGVVSDPLQILSYRLFHSPKVSQDDLRPNDSVSKMKGIGSQYAKRLGSLGIHRIVDLAAIEPDSLGSSGCEELLQCLRRQRGALTYSRLLTYIQQAAAVCERHPGEGSDHSFVHKVARPSSSSGARPVKRRRLSIQEATQLLGPMVS